jgi:hypothetical protein
MKIDNRFLYDKLCAHIGHDVHISAYGEHKDGTFQDVVLECFDCNEIVLDAEIYTLIARTDLEEE